MSFDLDAVANEANATPFDFTFGGEPYQLPPSVDILAVASMQAGLLYEGLARMLGDEQWARINASKAVLDQEKLKALLEAYGKHIGIPLGESLASTDS